MNELQAQSLVVKAVRDDGGYAFKLAHKFLIGIPDLLIQIPGHGTSLWEVKLARKTLLSDTALNLTAKQLKALRDFTKAGGTAGVISFLQTPRVLYIGVSTRFFLEMPVTQYRTLDRGQREIMVRRSLIEELER